MKLTLNEIQNMVLESIRRIINEEVYIDSRKMNHKKKTAGLTYTSNTKYNKGNYNSAEMLKTDKMELNNANVYLVPLKGGIQSYNITDIKGTEIMHYFKRLWDNKETKINVDVDGSITEYELVMLKQEEEEFFKKFVHKIELVVDDFIQNNIVDAETIRAISIYPVKSSSNFNKKMAEMLSQISVHGLPVQIISDDLLLKDLRNLEKDDDFIKKNQEFYDGKFSQTMQDNYGTVQQELDTTLAKQKALREVHALIPTLNAQADKVLQYYHVYSNKEASPKVLNRMAEAYKQYYDTFNTITSVKYIDYKGNTKGIHASKNIAAIPYTKGPSVANRSPRIWEMIAPYLRGTTSPVTGKRYTQMNVCKWSEKSFEIKLLSNSIRMGMRNIYNPNTDNEKLQAELDKIKGTLFLIFDDNISGGATLSDICYQCKQLGIENLLPITFGKMRESNTIGQGIKLSTPDNGYNLQ